MFEDYDRGERVQKTGMLRARLIIFGAIFVIGMIGVGVTKWRSSSLHSTLAKRHEITTAKFINNYKNGDGPNAVYALTYTFTVSGKTYENVGYSNINPKYPRGIVFYNPDDPDENELQPIPKEEEYPGQRPLGSSNDGLAGDVDVGGRIRDVIDHATIAKQWLRDP